ncbi:MAG: hypothetical protein KC442_22615 [Thermomicrobiales bacterium]|nr:hypothetical protein [Thermomicrobiales bacterium]
MAEASPSSLETVRRISESVIIAAISSVALYLVGFVYVDAYYGRLSLEILPPDLPASYVALQSIHALWGLLNYPLTLLVAVVLYRVLADPSRSPGQWLARARERFPRLLPVLGNLIVVAPLLLKAGARWLASELPHRSVRAEIASVLGYAGVILLLYALWLGWQRRYLLTEITARQVVPLALVFAAYLLSALVYTGEAAELAAVDLLTGASPATTRVTFATRPGVFPELAGLDLFLVAERGGTWYVVAREASPPSPWATSYAIPAGVIDGVRMRPWHAPDEPEPRP